ncbi:MAG: hypothetical protein F6K24_04020 [Okeania sp. SIO2D1]|nr:hypothetical protein [Okeania sp. SIO2D1]
MVAFWSYLLHSRPIILVLGSIIYQGNCDEAAIASHTKYIYNLDDL